MIANAIAVLLRLFIVQVLGTANDQGLMWREAAT
jgi:hypothetical protein